LRELAEQNKIKVTAPLLYGKFCTYSLLCKEEAYWFCVSKGSFTTDAVRRVAVPCVPARHRTATQHDASGMKKT